MTNARLLAMLAIPILFALSGAGCAHRSAEVSEKALEREFQRLSVEARKEARKEAKKESKKRSRPKGGFLFGSVVSASIRS
mgnify:CR=1 FL=1